MKWNPDYEKMMRELLGEEFEAFQKCMEESPLRGIRINTLKSTVEEVKRLTNLQMHKSPFADNGYILDSEEKGLGFTAAYQAGLYYLQEPSASAAVTVLFSDVDDTENMKVLDLCAAPGSKTTQILEKMNQKGLLVSNEINGKRASILLENVTRHGAANCIAANDSPKNISIAFPSYFDRILVDAPCSGSGMFRKDPAAIEEWSLDNVHMCAERQKEILESAYAALKGGGTMVYSTCTFCREENEDVIINFLNVHRDMKLVKIDNAFGREGLDEKGYTRRIYPMDGGEGHFMAKMVKEGDDDIDKKIMKSDTILKETKEFLSACEPYPYYYCHKGRVYGGTFPFVETGKVHVLSNQVYLGEEKKGRFEPDHALFLSEIGKMKNTVELDEEEIRRYFHGEQLDHPSEKGYCAVTYHGHALGGAKSDGSHLKNRFPKYLRMR